MKVRKGLLFAGSLLFIATGCASGGGGGATTSGPGVAGPAPATSSAADGESERDDEYTRAAEDFLDDAFAQETIGSQEQADQAFSNALAQARLAVENDPTNPKAHLLLGQAAVGNEEWELAAEAYSEALELRPAYLEETRAERETTWVELYNRGAPLISQGEYQAAIAIFSAADAINGERPEIKIILGQLLAQEQEYDRAIAVLEEAQMIIDGPRIEEVDSTTAASWIEQSADIGPTIAQSLLMSNRYEDAVPVLESLIAQYPEDLQYVFSLAGSFGELERTDEAIALYNEVAERPGLEASEYLELGIGLYQLDEYRDAAAAFMQAAEAAPYDRDALELGVNSLQLTYVGNDSLQASPAEVEAWIDMGERWIELDPNNPQAYTALAQGITRTDDQSRAPELLNTAEALPVIVRNLQMTRTRGGATVVGAVSANGDDAPSEATLEFTFYDAAGNVLGTETTSVTLSGSSAGINVQFDGEGVEGYGYEVVG